MDMYDRAMTLAQIVGLLCNYASNASDKKSLDFQEFLKWTVMHGHTEVAGAIERNHATTISVKAALAEGRDQLLERLNSLDEKLTAVAVGLGPIDAIARSLRPGTVLSDKAREMLCEFERTGAASAHERRDTSRGDGPDRKWIFLSAREQSDLEMDRRFYDDDVESLLRLGLVTMTRTLKGDRVFKLTRPGSDLAQQLLKVGR